MLTAVAAILAVSPRMNMQAGAASPAVAATLYTATNAKDDQS